MLDNHQKNIATFIHLSTFSRFLIPFGNFIGPIVLWMANKEKSEFVDNHGKQAINFQISILLYALVIGTLNCAFFHFKFLMEFDFIDFNGFHGFSYQYFGTFSSIIYWRRFRSFCSNSIYFRTRIYCNRKFKS